MLCGFAVAIPPGSASAMAQQVNASSSSLNSTSLDATLQLIQEKLRHQGEVRYKEEVKTPGDQGVDAHFDIYIFVQAVLSDSQACHLEIRSISGQKINRVAKGTHDILAEDDKWSRRFALKDVAAVQVLKTEAYEKQRIQEELGAGATVTLPKPSFVLVLTSATKAFSIHDEVSGYGINPRVDNKVKDKADVLYFREEDTAKEVAHALSDAMELCGGGHPPVPVQAAPSNSRLEDENGLPVLNGVPANPTRGNILGFTPGMDLGDVTTLLKRNGFKEPDGAVTQIAYRSSKTNKMQFTTDYGFLNYLTAESADSSSPDEPRDQLTIWFTPQDGRAWVLSQVFQISRHTEYKKASAGIREQDLMASLKGKYGTPKITRNAGAGRSGVMMWTTAEGLKPFAHEPTEADIANACAEWSVTNLPQTAGVSRLQDQHEPSPEQMKNSCGALFTVIRWTIDKNRQPSGESQIVYGFDLTLYDASIAAAGLSEANRIAAQAEAAER
jgi:hypothetical protein